MACPLDSTGQCTLVFSTGASLAAWHDLTPVINVAAQHLILFVVDASCPLHAEGAGSGASVATPARSRATASPLPFTRGAKASATACFLLSFEVFPLKAFI